MRITSYAQNFEDVILWRALKHVEHGFYLDVGAQDPLIDSVSLAFYERGWRGVHVEPTAVYAEKLRTARPGDEVVQAAVGTSPDPITLWEFPNTGLSTGDAVIAEEHRARGFEHVASRVPCVPLSEILDRFAGREIHWLKIDVEGMEDEVIDSWRPSRVRPWIVVIESTKPNSPEQNHMSWEPNLLGLGYDFIYFDGLNRFYVSAEHPEVKGSFGPGPNLFDDFTLATLEALRRELHDIHQSNHYHRQLAQEQADEIAALKASISWRALAPLRALLKVISRLDATRQKHTRPSDD